MKSNNNIYFDKSILVMCSGGVDSVLLAYKYRKQIKALMFFDYGQPAKTQELKATRFFGAQLDLPVEVVSIPLQAKALEGDGACVVPERNLVMTAYALHYAAVHGIDLVFYGAIWDDRADYIDCRPEWVRLLRHARHAQAMGQPSKHPPMPELEAPLSLTLKADVICEAAALGVDLSKTWSCYNPADQGLPCGSCASCRLLIDGMSVFENKKLYQDAP